MQVKVTLTRRARRRLVGFHVGCSVVLLLHAATLTGWVGWLVAFCAAETLATTVLYVCVVAPVPKPRASATATHGRRQADAESTKADRSTAGEKPVPEQPRRPSWASWTRSDKSV
ncbi:hypothetical protein [Cryptosporangium japonicum]|uniref:Uncharacterized protein n=1 Tax=Cryptosporangium japonicum TaxID=80872 RepID=A0ABP3E8Z5_9ACTN